MLFFVTKTGLDAFDTARAWGLAVLLNVLTEDEVKLQDAGWAFILEPAGHIPNNAQLTGLIWGTIFAAEDVQWQQVFVTQRGRQEAQKQKVQRTLEANWQTLLSDFQRVDNLVAFGRGETLPGGLEPSAFKGLRHWRVRAISFQRFAPRLKGSLWRRKHQSA